MDYLEQSRINIQKAEAVISESGIAEICKAAGCEVRLVGSLRMGLLAKHRDIDLHVYSSGITVKSSFAMIAEITENKNVVSLTCENGLHTDERCVSWHILYRSGDDEIWQFDIIHIEQGSRYDGYFERMADRIVERLSEEQRETILRLKFETPEDRDFHGVEYYQSVLEGGVSTLEELQTWIAHHRANPPQEYWMP